MTDPQIPFDPDFDPAPLSIKTFHNNTGIYHKKYLQLIKNYFGKWCGVDAPKQPANREQPKKIFSGVNSKFAFIFGLTIGLIILLAVMVILLINR